MALRAAIEDVLAAIEIWRAEPAKHISVPSMLGSVADQAQELMSRLGPQAGLDAVLAVARFLLESNWSAHPKTPPTVSESIDALWLASLRPEGTSAQ